MPASIQLVQPTCVLSVTGSDRQAWLHNFCSNDIKRLVAGEGCEAFFLNVKGKTLCHAIVLCHETSLSVLTLGVPCGSLPEHLDHYIIREDVRIHDQSAQRQIWWSENLGANHPQPASAWSHRAIRPGIIRLNARVTSDGDELFLVDTAMVQSDGSWTQSLHLEMTAGNRFEVARIANRWPLNSIDVTASNLPQEFDRDAEAISFVKGCYLGQETVARIDAIGHVNRRLVAIRSRVPATELEGQELFDPENREKPLGKITSAAAVGDGRTIALAMVRVAGLQPGASWQTPAGAVTLA